MKEIKDNPLKSIFTPISVGKFSPEIKSIKNINNFFTFLKDSKNSIELKSKILDEFTLIIKEHRWISEYFSYNDNNKSIYIFLFVFYLKPYSNDKLKKSIINLIKELILNIEVDKKIYEFIFQKISSLYREEEKILPDSLSNYLTLLNSILSDTENRIKPYNYFCCNGEGNFNINLSELNLSINFSITFIINFKIGKINIDKNKKIISNLIKINFIKGNSINIDLEYPKNLIVKEIKDTFLKTFPENEWINLVVTLTGAEKKINLYFLVNGEYQLSPFKYPTSSINYKDVIDSIQFFNNFYGEVSSITMISQNKDFETSSVPPKEFLSEFKLYKEGLWKRKKISNFIELLKKTNTNRKNTLNLIFLFSPMNKVYNSNENVIDSACNNLSLKFTGNIRLHNYQCYQKKLYLVNVIKNILPIPELFLIHPKLLNDNNFQLFLQIIINILQFRKKNMKFFKECKFFQVLSLFIEKLPNKLFNEKTLEYFCEIGRCIFPSKFEKLSSNYFKHILLNEKILSKYSEDLQVKFWNNLLLFTQSDKYQVSNYINMNKICLILRFYDKNKYTEICCENHLSMIKDEFIGNKTVMNPTMSKKLSYLENILTVIINSQEPKNACSLFKLLTLDLSPCLTLFIINIFIKAFQKNIKTVKWKDQLIMELINNKYEVIIVNSFLHGLPDIKCEILKLMHEIHLRLLTIGKGAYFRPFEKMIKTCFLPQNMFYYSKDEKNNTNKNINTTLKTNIIKNNNEINKNSVKTNNEIKNKNNETKKIDKPAPSIKITEERKKIDFGHKKMISEIKTKKEDDEFTIHSSNTLETKNFNDIEKDLNFPKKTSTILDKINALNQNMSKINKPINKPLNNNKNNIIKPKENLSKSIIVTPPAQNNNNSIKEKQKKLFSKSTNIIQQNDSTTNSTKIVNSNISNKECSSNDSNDKNNNKDNINIVQKSIINGTLILKDNLLKNYKNNLFNIFYLWAMGLKLEDDITKINFEKSLIKNPNIIEILFSYINELNDINYTIQFLDKMHLFISNFQNAYTIFSNKKIYSVFLDFSFSCYKTKNNDKKESECFSKSKTITLEVFINSLIYMEKNHVINPCSDIDTIFIWGHELFERINEKDKIFDFMNEFLFECLTLFKIKFEPKMKYNIKDNNFKPQTNFYLKNYFILITYLFEFCFIFNYEIENDINSLNPDDTSKKINSELKKYISSMRFNDSNKEINHKWIDFPFFDDIYKRFNNFWGITSNLQKIFKSQTKGNKVLKYEEILNQSILDKDNKNTFLKELELLCYEELNNENKKTPNDKNKKVDIIIAPIDLITISMMCILSVTDNEKDIKYWLKEFKYFIRFLIISSSNLIKTNQIELYNTIQEKLLCTLSSCICFLNDLVNKFKVNKSKFKEKAEKNLQKILLFCLIVTKYQYQFALEHKNKLNILKILNKNQNENDLSSCAVFLLFSEYIKDKTNSPILTQQKIDQFALSQYVTVVEHFNKPEIIEGFYENQILKNKINSNIFFFIKLKKLVEERIENIKNVKEEYDYKYKDEILDLLPLYEKELMKYSNNSLEKNIKYKNIYRISKKQSFSWLGFWSDRKLFFENTEKLKQKLVNHISKTLMKPLISPILDITYYLPEFSGFKPEKLFNPPKKNDKNKNNFKLSMDIDKILRLSEQNQITMNNIKESFGGKKHEIKENYQRSIYSKSSLDLANSLLKIANHLDFGKEEEFFFIEKEKHMNTNNNNNIKKNKKYFLSCLVKASHHIKGVFFIDEKKINFKIFLNQKTGNAMIGVEVGFTNKDDDYDNDRKTCFGSYFVCHPKDKDLYKISINYDDIKWFFRRRYYYKNSGLEIFTVSNKSFYFNFKYEEDREIVINEILSKLNDCPKIIDDLKENKDIFENIIGYDNTFSKNKKIKKIKLSKKIELWKEWEISNFEFIMWLNIYGNRSYNDISQYPIFPWLINNYEDPIIEEISSNEITKDKKQENKNITENENSELVHIPENKYRDLSEPMGMLTITEEGKIRKSIYLESFENLKRERNPNMIPYIYGSNYSNPTYVCNYMTRIFPYTHIGIELQGDKFDDPNRLFTSIKSTFKSSTTQKADVRELIPEFFYLPEMYINLNDLDMGIKDDGKKVGDVDTPCQNNPYEFTHLMRYILENDTISYNIQNWVDLIFGYKNKGKEAELAHNVFIETSYQEGIDLKKVENKDLYLRYAEFGLIPNQIMSKECEKKMKKEEKLKGKEITNPTVKLVNNECKPSNVENPLYIIKNNNIVLKLGIFSEGKISILLNNFLYIEKKISYSMFDKTYNEEIINYVKLEDNNNTNNNFETPNNNMSEFYSEHSSNNKCIQFFNHGKNLIMGGFYDGKLMIYSIENKKNKFELYPFIEDKPILSVEIDKEENYAFLGNSIGNICIYQIDIDDPKKWKLIQLKTEQISPISHINCNNDLNLWSSTTIDGYINIYTLPQCKLIRCIKVPTKKCSYTFLSSSPLPSVIVINDEENNSELYVYSINGKFLFKQQEYMHLTNPILIKDINSYEYLAFVGNNNIIIRKLPNLDIQANIDCLPGTHSICISDDIKSLFTVDKNGKKIVLIKDEK